MPSRVTGFAADTAGRPAYSSHPPPPPGVRGQGGPPSPPSAAQSKPYYGYAVAPSSSYESHPPPYPRGPPPEHSEYPYDRGYSYDNSPEAAAEQDPYRRVTQGGPPPPPPGRYPGPYERSTSVPGASSSPPSRKGSYDHQQHDYARPPEGSTYGGPPLRSRSSGSGGSASPHTSPPRYRDRRPPHGPPHGYSEPPPHQYIPGRPPPRPMDGHGRPPPPAYSGASYETDHPWAQQEGGAPEPERRGHYDDERAAHDHYSWGAPHAPSTGPYSSATYHAPHPRGRRPMNPDYIPRPRAYDAHSSRQASDATHEEARYAHSAITNGPQTMLHRGPEPGLPNGVATRALSPTQIDSSRRDEVTNMGCTCKKSKCLKLYCMCFGASVVCGPNCRCLVCYNTPNHESERKEAVRSILARNPTAFDTKFKKSSEKAAEKIQSDRGLAHKLGCKCRKSACVKKYCECYGAGVKCSAACRCVGCQNMPPGEFAPDPRFGYSMAVRPFASAMQIRSSYMKEEQASTKPGEPWMVDAAQNLAFLKHASPHRPEGRPLGPSDAQGIASMPSLVSSDTTPNSDTETPGQDASPAPVGRRGTETAVSRENEKNTEGVANALLMAAYAMTELHTEASDPPRRSPPPVPSVDGNVFRASPKRKSTETGGATGPFAADGPEDHHQPPVTYDVPTMGYPAAFPDVVKQDDVRTAPLVTASDPSLMTPSEQRKIKRTRVGSLQKPFQSGGPKEASLVVDETPRPERQTVDSDEEAENKSMSSNTVEEAQDEMTATPAAKATSSKSSQGALTPVTARCIDFRHMDVNEVNGKKNAK